MVISHYRRNLHWELGEKDAETEVAVTDRMAIPIRSELCQRSLLTASEGAGNVESNNDKYSCDQKIGNKMFFQVEIIKKLTCILKNESAYHLQKKKKIFEIFLIKILQKYLLSYYLNHYKCYNKFCTLICAVRNFKL